MILPVDRTTGGSAAWFALYVKAHHEFVVQKHVGEKGFEVYLPTINRMRHWKDRIKRIDSPFFPGYLFTRLLPVHDQFLDLLKTQGVIRILSTVPGSPTPVPEAQIAALKILLANDRELDVHPELEPGKVVRITRGPLKGVEGCICRKNGQLFLHVNVTIMGRCVAVKMYQDEVELA